MSLRCRIFAALGLAAALATPVTASAGPTIAPVMAAQPPTYADIADLADSASLVLIARLRKLSPIDPAQARGVMPGMGRFLARARTLALVAGVTPVGSELRYLVDLPLDARGRPPKLGKADMLLFARPVPGRPGELQLVTPRAQLSRLPETEAAARAILMELVSPQAPARVAGVTEAIHVPGALMGLGETQIFLSTANGSAASMTVRHRPGEVPAWGASFSELTGDTGNPPMRHTLAWYRLACFLPAALPRGANLSETATSRARAEADYRMVLGELGDCPRSLG